MIPNHEAVISFGGKQGVNLYATVTCSLFVQIKKFCEYVIVTVVTYERVLKQPRHMHESKNETCIRTFIMISTTLNPPGPLTGL